MKKKKGDSLFLKVVNSKPFIGAMIFIFLSLVSVFASDVIFKQGNLDIGNNLNVSNNSLYVNSTTGRVGIGMSAPTAKLEIRNNVSELSLKINHNSSSFFAQYIQTDTHGLRIIGDGTAGNNQLLRIQGNGGNTEALYAGANGKVGIGTINPTDELNVLGDVNVTGGFKGSMKVGDQNVIDYTVPSTLTIGGGITTSNFGNGNYNSGSISLYDASNNNVWYYLNRGSLSGEWGIFTIQHFNGSAFTNAFIIQNNSYNVGIGTSKPTHKLNVVGGINVTTLSVNSSGAIPIYWQGGVLSTASSTRSSKTDITPINKISAINDIMNLSPVTFKYLGSDKTRNGLIYEDAIKVNPSYGFNVSMPQYEEVCTDKIDKSGNLTKFCENKVISSKDAVGIYWEDVTADTLAVVQQQQTEIDAMKQELCSMGKTKFCD